MDEAFVGSSRCRLPMSLALRPATGPPPHGWAQPAGNVLACACR